MLQLFRSFQWANALVVLACALLLRAAVFALGEVPPQASGALGVWGQALLLHPDGRVVPWLVGAALVAAVGFFAAFTLQHHRLGSAGTFPALVGILLGSAASWWLGYLPHLVATLLIAGAAQSLFAGYKRQGDALPVYNCGLLVGAAGLVSPPFFWFALWQAIALAQLRKFRLNEQVNMLIGVLTLPLIVGIWCFTVGDFSAFRQNVLSGALSLPSVAAWREVTQVGFPAGWQPLTVLALATGGCVGTFGRLTTRRPIQEQRASRMWYTMLAVGWLALLFSSIPLVAGIALLLYPLSVLLGIWLSELSRTPAKVVVLVALAAILGAYMWMAFTSR